MTIFWSLPLVEHADFVLTEKKILSQKKKLITFLFLCPQNSAWMLIAVWRSSKKVTKKYFWKNLERIGEFIRDNS